MRIRSLALAATLVLAAVACGATPSPPPSADASPSAAPSADASPSAAPSASAAPMPASGCARTWTGEDAVPADFLTCSTNDDCTLAKAGGCCGGSVAVNRSHAACMRAKVIPCRRACPPPKHAAQCVKGACTLVPAP